MNKEEASGKVTVSLASLLNKAATDYESQAVNARACVERCDQLRIAYDELAQVLIELAAIKRDVAKQQGDRPDYDWSSYHQLFKRREQLQTEIQALVKAQASI